MRLRTPGLSYMSGLSERLRKKLLTGLLVILCYLTCSTSTAAPSPSEKQIVHFTTWGWSNQIADYYKEIVATVFDITTDKYGPYELAELSKETNNIRALRNSRYKNEVYINFSGSKYTDQERKEFVNQYKISILLNVLGLRKLIVRAEDKERFSAFTSKQEIKKLIIGQRQIWPDSRVYSSAGLQVIQSDLYQSLYPMLKAKRFDVLPLSIIEAESALLEQYKFLENLSILENTYIFYPFPTFVGISKTHPDIAKRFIEGLTQIKLSGELDNIFSSHFGIFVESIMPDNSTIVFLKNPTLTEEQNQKAFDNILNTYFTPLSTTIRL